MSQVDDKDAPSDDGTVEKETDDRNVGEISKDVNFPLTDEDGAPNVSGSRFSGASAARTLQPMSSPTLLRRKSRLSSQVSMNSDGPKIDEAAIYAMTHNLDKDDDIERSSKGSRESTDGQEGKDRTHKLSDSRPSLRRASSSRSGTMQQLTGQASESKRMTVVLDEEMPSEASESIHSLLDDVKGTFRSDENVRLDNQAISQSQNGDDGEPVIEEPDADVDGLIAVEKEEDTEQKDQIPPVAAVAMPDLAQSMATLRAAREMDQMRTEKGQDTDDLAHAEQDDDADEDQDEEEPSLKYSRLRGSVPDMLKRDSASALAVSDRFLALGTHGGSIYILDEQGNLIKGFRTHTASVLALVIDSTSEFVGSAGMDGLVSVAALSSSESYTYDFKRVMRSIALEPGFGWRSSRAFLCGGMAGQLVLREKSWFGHREVILHEGEGPIWTTQWRGNLIAWANDRGVRIYDTASKQRITFISPPDDKPRADLFRCTLYWQDDATLIIAWGDTIKVAKVRKRENSGAGKVATSVLPASASSTSRPIVEISAILQLDCMISGLAPRGGDYLILAYLTEEDYTDEEGSSFDVHKRRAGQRPELRLISSDGEELSSDVLSLQSFARFQCNDYLLVPSSDAVINGAAALSKAKDAIHGDVTTSLKDDERDYFYVVSPKDVVIARSRDQKDHIEWLLQHRHYQEALEAVETLGQARARAMGFDIGLIGAKYLHYLMYDKRDWEKAASVAPSILKDSTQAWEDTVLAFVEQKALRHLIDRVPVRDPRLSTVVYDMILAFLLQHNLPQLHHCIKTWPVEIYSAQAVVLALEDRLGQNTVNKDTAVVRSTYGGKGDDADDELVMECLADIHLRNRQPGKALPYFMRLRRPDVFDLIREHNLFTVVQDQALLLVEFEEDLLKKSLQSSSSEKYQIWQSIQLLVDHTHSIPIHRVVSQLQGHRKHLFKYLDALFDRDPQLVAQYSDMQVELYAELAYDKLMAYLRTMSSYYSFEKAYNTCKALDYVPEMVFLLSRIGDNKTALMLIIERMGDVERAISFVKEEKDPELWDDLVQYSEDKPNFIRGLLENVGGEVDAVKLIRRIKNDLHIEGLRDALIKILGDFNLQISLLEGCANILAHDGQMYAQILHRGQTGGMYGDEEVACTTCKKPLLSQSTASCVPVRQANSGSDKAPSRQKTMTVTNVLAEGAPTNVVYFLCGHAHHLACLLASTGASVPARSTNNANAMPSVNDAITMTTTRALATSARHAGVGAYGPMQRARQRSEQLQNKIRYQARLRVVLRKGCPECHAEHEQFRLYQ